MLDDAAWYRVQEIERRLREVELGADVERSKLRQMIGEMRALRGFEPNITPEPRRLLTSTDPVTIRTDPSFTGFASSFAVLESDVVVRTLDGIVLFAGNTGAGSNSITVTYVSTEPYTIEATGPAPRFGTATVTRAIGELPGLVLVPPATGYRPLSWHGSTWTRDWEAWKNNVRITDATRGNANLTNTTDDQTTIGTHNGSAVEYRIDRNLGTPAVRIRWFAGSGFATLFVYLTTLTLPRLGTYQATGSFTGIPGPNPHPWGSGSVTITITVDENI